MTSSPARGQPTPEASTSTAPYGSPPSPARLSRRELAQGSDIARSSSAGRLPYDDPHPPAPQRTRYELQANSGLDTRRPLGARRSTVADSYENPRNTPNLPPINTHLQPTARSQPLPLSPTYNSSRHSLKSPQQPTAPSSSQLSSTSLPPRKSSQELAAPPFAGSSKYDSVHPPERSTASPAHSTGSGSSHRHPHQHSGEGSGGSSPREREKRLGSSNVMSPGGSREGERGSQVCAKCSLPMAGQFVRALGTVFHLDCFRCQVCPFSFLG